MNPYTVRTMTESEAILTLATSAMESKMNTGESFTALDISNTLKAKSFPVRHREVSAVVRGLYAGGGMTAFGYARELIAVSTPDGSAQAYLYRQIGQTASDYVGDAQNALPPVPTDRARPLDDVVPAGMPLSPLAGAALQGMVGAAVIGGSGATAWGKPSPARTRGAFRRDGALAVPRNLIEQSGFREGDLLVLTRDARTDTLVLGPVPIGSAAVAGAIVKVWRDLRVRIARTKLSLAGGTTVVFAAPVRKPSFVADGSALRIAP